MPNGSWLATGDCRLAISQVASHSAIFYQVYQNCKKDHLRTFSLRFVAQESRGFLLPYMHEVSQIKITAYRINGPMSQKLIRYDPAQERSRKQRAIFTIPYTIGEVHYIMQTVDCVSQID